MLASGPVPPCENVTVPPGTADGEKEPSALRCRDVFTGTQPLPRRTRTGSTFSWNANPPCGSATVVDVEVVSWATVTAVPVERACAKAAVIAAAAGALPSLSGTRGLVG